MFKHTLPSPAPEALEDTVPLAEVRGEVAPGGAGTGMPEDGLNEEAVVLGGTAGVARLAGTEGRNLGPHAVGEKGSVGIHGSAPALDMPPFSACVGTGAKVR
ncbi:MAG: hypothetical protein OXE84_04460 [Rhodobacteraceae bacterium]|nr:hypothetical protein [Paracoccaceae bacterium]MCY4196524.1 hypothetical protein [Paracoccaceae bacterium]